TAQGCGWTGKRKAAALLPADAVTDKPCPQCGGEVKVGGPAPTSVQTTPSGMEIAFWDSTNVETGIEQQRRYTVNGERVPSVSSILRTLGPKDAIAPWAVKQRDEGKDWREESRLAAERGTAAHDLLLRAMLSERTSLAD